MNRRSFMKGILAAGAAPYVVTSAGVLMPVRDLWKPKVILYLRLTPDGDGGVIRWMSRDQVNWHRDLVELDPFDLTVFKEEKEVHLRIDEEILILPQVPYVMDLKL